MLSWLQTKSGEAIYINIEKKDTLSSNNISLKNLHWNSYSLSLSLKSKRNFICEIKNYIVILQISVTLYHILFDI